MNVSYTYLKEVLFNIFLKNRFTKEKAELLAQVIADSTLDGVNTHGVDRVRQLLEYINLDLVKVDKEASFVFSAGSIEQWDGNYGPGIINATICMNRAIELAGENGLSMVALRNTNHWLRGGTYGWQAANAGFIAMCFTNTKPNMPPWGGKENRIGNNPVVVAIPRKNGHIVLDMALSQFSFGKINTYKQRGEELPFYGGWNTDGDLTKNPGQIINSERGLPIGYWKGSAFSMVIDIFLTLLSGGDSTSAIGSRPGETGLSQVFLCINPAILGSEAQQQEAIEKIISFNRECSPLHPGSKVFYPGEQTKLRKEKNLKDGIFIDDKVWSDLQRLSQ